MGISVRLCFFDARDGGVSAGDLVLIDWEVMGIGPAAFDAAYIVWWLPMVCDPSKPSPDFCWSEELPDYYFSCYVAAGGKALGYEAFIRQFRLAGLLPSLWVVPATLGRRLRVLRGLAQVRRMVGVAEDETLARLKAMGDMLEHHAERAARAARRWLA